MKYSNKLLNSKNSNFNAVMLQRLERKDLKRQEKFWPQYERIAKAISKKKEDIELMQNQLLEVELELELQRRRQVQETDDDDDEGFYTPPEGDLKLNRKLFSPSPSPPKGSNNKTRKSDK